MASATSATNASTIAPTATASLTPVCAPCAAAMMMLAGSLPRHVSASTGVAALGSSSGSSPSPAGSSGMMILAIRMPPGADMKRGGEQIGQEMRAEQAGIGGEDRARDAGHADASSR